MLKTGTAINNTFNDAMHLRKTEYNTFIGQTQPVHKRTDILLQLVPFQKWLKEHSSILTYYTKSSMSWKGARLAYSQSEQETGKTENKSVKRDLNLSLFIDT